MTSNLLGVLYESTIMLNATSFFGKNPTCLSKRKLFTLAKLYRSKQIRFIELHNEVRILNVKKKNCFLDMKSTIAYSSALRQPTSTLSGTLTIQQAQELALRLTSDERKCLVKALQEFESKIIKDEYEGQLAAHRWRSKFGRPSKVPKLGDVDPTGSYCPVPEDWLKEKYASTIPTPSPNDLFHLSIANSIPFIGFGFLDNFIMIVAGDYIDHLLGTYIYLSTMAAAALGNTFSDVIGIGSAFYVERFAEKIGFRPPELTPMQLDMPISRRASNMGRVLGITIGCLLGMIPLLFIKDQPKPTPKGITKNEVKDNVDAKSLTDLVDQSTLAVK